MRQHLQADVKHTTQRWGYRSKWHVYHLKAWRNAETVHYRERFNNDNGAAQWGVTCVDWHWVILNIILEYKVNKTQENAAWRLSSSEQMHIYLDACKSPAGKVENSSMSVDKIRLDEVATNKHRTRWLQGRQAKKPWFPVYVQIAKQSSRKISGKRFFKSSGFRDRNICLRVAKGQEPLWRSYVSTKGDTSAN